jgi:hypothetical protein
MNLLIKNKYQWSIGSDGQCHTLTNLVEKSTKLKCEVGHMEFVEINKIMQSKTGWLKNGLFLLVNVMKLLVLLLGYFW